MKIRAMQIWGFLLTALGWTFVACSLAMEGWKVTSVGGQGGSAIMTVGWYWSSLWRACYTDSANTSNCYDFPVLWSVEGYMQIVRALLMAGMAGGVLGFILCLVGMECTYIGGKDKEKNRSAFLGGVCHVSSGFVAASGYAVYAHYVSAEYFDPRFDGLKFDLGTPLFLGWSGCAFEITGGIFFLVSVCKMWSDTCDTIPSALMVPAVESSALRSSPTDLSIISELSSNTNMSAISDLVSKSEPSAVSNVLSNPEHIKNDHASRSRAKSRCSYKSEMSRVARSSRSSPLSRSQFNGKNVSFPSRANTDLFIKNSYI